jgi:hypothetical protein
MSTLGFIEYEQASAEVRTVYDESKPRARSIKSQTSGRLWRMILSG